MPHPRIVSHGVRRACRVSVLLDLGEGSMRAWWAASKMTPCYCLFIPLCHPHPLTVGWTWWLLMNRGGVVASEIRLLNILTSIFCPLSHFLLRHSLWVKQAAVLWVTPHRGLCGKKLTSAANRDQARDLPTAWVSTTMARWQACSLGYHPTAAWCGTWTQRHPPSLCLDSGTSETMT